MKGALAQAAEARPGFDPAQVIGIGVDTTGSTPIPVDAKGTPLASCPVPRQPGRHGVAVERPYRPRRSGEEITAKAARDAPPVPGQMRRHVLAPNGAGRKSCTASDSAPTFSRRRSFVEHCDCMPGRPDRDDRPGDDVARDLFGRAQGDVLRRVGRAARRGVPRRPRPGARRAPRTGSTTRAVPPTGLAGGLTAEWAGRLGLAEGTAAVAVGAFDAHMGAVGAGVETGTLVKILGTSTCDMMVSPDRPRPLADIPGVCGIVDGSILPGFYGIEAGQSAVGDIFLWFVNHLVPDSYGATPDAKVRRLEKARGPDEAGRTRAAGPRLEQREPDDPRRRAPERADSSARPCTPRPTRSTGP